MTPRVFITHSSIDKELADAVVEILRLGTDLSSNQIFCSSVEGLGIPTGQTFMQYIKNQLASTELVVPLITPAYLDSTFCMWELGATWVRGVDTYPILVPPVKTDNLPGPLRTMQVARLDSPGMNGLASTVAAKANVSVIQDTWERKRNAFLSSTPALLLKLGTEWAATPQARLRKAARYAQAMVSLRRIADALRDANYLHIVNPDSLEEHPTLLPC